MIEFFVMAFFIAGPPHAQAAAQAQTPPPGAPKTPTVTLSHPVTIAADKLEILGKQSQAIWSGNVRAQRGEALLTCERLTAAYTTPEDIRRLTCGGGVRVVEGDRTASGETADFDNVSGLLELTGSPQAHLGRNVMKGSKVAFDVGRDTLRVENAKTTFESIASGRTPTAGGVPGFKRPIAITSQRLEVQNGRRQATWLGNVRARHDDMLLTCDRLIATYTAEQEIRQMSCIGHVEVQDGNTWARGERADFHADSGTVVVTGDPEVKQGANHLRASRVTFRMGSDALEIENARAILRTAPDGRPQLPRGRKP